MKSFLFLLIGIGIGSLMEHYWDDINHHVFGQPKPMVVCDTTIIVKMDTTLDVRKGLMIISEHHKRPCEQPLNGCYIVINRKGQYAVKLPTGVYLWDMGYGVYSTSNNPYTTFADSCDAKRFAVKYIENERDKKSFKKTKK